MLKLLCSAGTGLLSMMAARSMGLGDSSVDARSKGMVTACESYLPMVKLVRKVLRANGMDKRIRLINKRSDELEVGVDITSRADILVSIDIPNICAWSIPTLKLFCLDKGSNDRLFSKDMEYSK